MAAGRGRRFDWRQVRELEKYLCRVVALEGLVMDLWGKFGNKGCLDGWAGIVRFLRADLVRFKDQGLAG